MQKRKPTNKYYFSVEGETEQWYLKWLQDMINSTEESVCKVSIDCPVKKNPLKHAKSLTVTRKIEIYHFFDYESDEPIHVQGFQDVMDNMKKAEKLGKQIKYKSGYSNFTFDLWIILHMVVPIGKPLMLSPAFPPASTGHATFTASGAPSSIVSAVIHTHFFTLAKSVCYDLH